MKNKLNRFTSLIVTVLLIFNILTISVFGNENNNVLPSSYDLRKTGQVTSVKNQLQVDDCWAFSAMGSVESNLLRIEKKNYDFSEINMVLNNGTTNNINAGGNNRIAAGYFASWKGPVYEADDPNPANANSVQAKKGLTAAKHIQEVLFIPDRTGALDNNELKKAVMKYGAVSSSLYMDENTYLNSAGNAYYDYRSSYNNHAIDIVGWNDNYSKNNFKVSPAGNGAFICKNSWGTKFGDSGYFYVSYYDVSIGYDNAVFSGIEPSNNYSKSYQYDSQYNGNVYYPEGYDNWFSNVFTANGDSSKNEVISAVSFYTNKKNAKYVVYAENNYASNRLTKIASKPVASGTIEMPGYHTVKLSNPVYLNTGGQFAVAVKVSGASIPIDSATASSNSYVSYDGVSWKTYGKTVDLKAFTTLNSKIQSDVNGDGKIDIKDIAAVAQKYNITSKDSSKWNKNYDINRDGMIDIYDLVYISKRIN